MKTLLLTVSREDVYSEVEKTTEYTGAKMMHADDGAHDRLSVTEADRELLSRFFDEAAGVATDECKRFVDEVTLDEAGYEARLSMSDSYDEHLSDSIRTSLRNFFVAAVIAKWCKITGSGTGEAYAADASAAMLDVRRKLYYRKKPQRVKPKQ